MTYKIISGFVALMAIGILIALAYDIYMGVAHTKSGTAISLSTDPSGFWTLAAFHLAIAGAFVWASIKAWRAGQRHPNF